MLDSLPGEEGLGVRGTQRGVGRERALVGAVLTYRLAERGCAGVQSLVGRYHVMIGNRCEQRRIVGSGSGMHTGGQQAQCREQAM